MGKTSPSRFISVLQSWSLSFAIWALEVIFVFALLVLKGYPKRGYLKGQPNIGLWYPKDSPFDLVAYTDSDYAGASLDRKSTTRGCQFLGCRLISWQCKKQTVVVNFTTEAEYVATSSCCGQAKTVNREVQLQALVDGKKVIITESTIRRDLQLEDAEGIDCLPNATIFEITHYGRPRRKDTEVPQPSSPTTNVVDEAVYEERDDSLERAATTATGLDAGQGRQETIRDTIAQTRSENVSKFSNDPLLARGNTLRSGKDRLKLQELMELCTNLQNRVIDLENTKTAQAQEIISLKLRVKKLEKKERQELTSSKDYTRLITLVDETQGRYGEDIMFDVSDLASEEVFVAEQGVSDKDVNLSIDEVTLAQALAAFKSAKVQEKSNVVEEPSESITTTPTLTTTTAATTITAASTKPMAKGLVIHKQEYGYIKNHKKTVKNGQARTRERKSVQKPEAKPKNGQASVKLQEEAQVSLTWIASLAIRVRSLSDPTAKNKDLMIRDDQRWMIDGS
ncbi:hypothetical protein Tco_0949272 [Tanacetum coccineum]